MQMLLGYEQLCGVIICATALVSHATHWVEGYEYDNITIPNGIVVHGDAKNVITMSMGN